MSFTSAGTGCTLKVVLNLPSDGLSISSNYSDIPLLSESISNKTQVYSLSKGFYKTKERKKVLEEIQSISFLASEKFRSSEITVQQHDSLQTEAKYIIQRSIYMMKDEFEQQGLPDPILDYLKTGLGALQSILNN